MGCFVKSPPTPLPQLTYHPCPLENPGILLTGIRFSEADSIAKLFKNGLLFDNYRHPGPSQV
jgi:uncharacterized protein CbrC (UPF0167 family)